MEKRYKARQLQLQKAAQTFEEQFELDRNDQKLKFEAIIKSKNAQIARFKTELDALIAASVVTGGGGGGSGSGGGGGGATAFASALPY